ncbi:hypothetical protein ACWEOR_31555, partial [Micromonospora chalcea]
MITAPPRLTVVAVQFAVIWSSTRRWNARAAGPDGGVPPRRASIEDGHLPGRHRVLRMRGQARIADRRDARLGQQRR